MTQVDYVRFLPLTNSEVLAKKVNYRQEKRLQSQLRSIEKEEKYSKNNLEKSNSVLKQNMTSRIQNSVQSCLKYSNSDKDGEFYVQLNRTKCTENSKLRSFMPRLTMMCDTKQSKDYQNFIHRRLTRSSSDSCTLRSPPPQIGLPKKQSSLDSTDPPPQRRRSATLYDNTKENTVYKAWGPTTERVQVDDFLPKLTNIKSQQHQQQQQLQQTMQEKQSRQHKTIQRTRSLPNNALYTPTPLLKANLTVLAEVNNDDFADLNSRKQETTIERSPNFAPLGKKLLKERLRAWYEAEDCSLPNEINNNSRRLRSTKSNE